MENFKGYRRMGITFARPYEPGEDMFGVSVSEPDRSAGSPKAGDMIARNPDNHADKWLISAAYWQKQRFSEVDGEG